MFEKFTAAHNPRTAADVKAIFDSHDIDWAKHFLLLFRTVWTSKNEAKAMIKLLKADYPDQVHWKTCTVQQMQDLAYRGRNFVVDYLEHREA